MILGIDASNIRRGGGITHLVEILEAANPIKHGFTKVIVWSSTNTLDKIANKPWLVKSHQPQLDKNLFHRMYWQRYKLSSIARKSNCKIVLVPGGSFVGNFEPMVTMSRNMLPFEWIELSRYGISIYTLKWLVLRMIQSKTFKSADGVIFLTEYAKNSVTSITGPLNGQVEVIPHGMNKQFLSFPKESRETENCSLQNPIRLLYVSIIDEYKHQSQVARAVSQLRAEGLPITIDFVGPSYKPSLRKLLSVMNEVDPNREFLKYCGPVDHKELTRFYHNAEIFIFASSCENMPNILIEAMASGIPIISSDRGPMPEVLGEAGMYFDPENIDSIKNALFEMLKSAYVRDKKARLSYEIAKEFSWSRCASETFNFLSFVLKKSKD